MAFTEAIVEGLDSSDNPNTPITAKRLNEPFFLETASYDSNNDDINITVGHGRADFGSGEIVERKSDATVTISNPSSSTTYHVFLKNDGTEGISTGSFTTKQNDPNPASDESLLGKIDTPSTLSNTSESDLTDLRGFLAGASIAGAAKSNREVFTSDGTFTVPTGVSKVFVTIVAGGGGGAGQGDSPAGGGSGASYINRKLSVTAGNDISVTVGTGGDGGDVNNLNGVDGGSSSFGSISATGGSGGELFNAGGTGGRPAPTSEKGSDNGGGRGGDSINGLGGSTGKNGSGFGSGGGGGGQNQDGGDGADGIVIVEW